MAFMFPNARLIDCWMWQRPGVIDDRTKVANVDPPAALRASDVTVCPFGIGSPVSFIIYLPRRIGLIERHPSSAP